MRLALLLLAFALLAPAAAAQLGLVEARLSVFVEDPGRAFVPGTSEPVSVVATYAPDQGGRPAPAPTADRPEDVQGTRISFVMKVKPEWVTDVYFDPPEVLIFMGLDRSVQTSYSARVLAYLNVSPDAPALERESFVVTATADPNGNIAGASGESPDLKLRATTVGLLNVTAEPNVVLSGGRWTIVPYTVRNDGNSEIVAKINVTIRPENSQVSFRPQGTGECTDKSVETLQLARHAEQVIDVCIRTPWTNAEFGELELEAVPIVDAEPGTPARALVAVRGESAVPFPAGLAILGLLVIARLRRSPRRHDSATARLISTCRAVAQSRRRARRARGTRAVARRLAPPAAPAATVRPAHSVEL